MKIAHVAAAVLVMGYLGLEFVFLTRASERTEADAMYRSLLAARVAVTRCDDPPRQQIVDFEAVVDRIEDRLRRELAEADSPPTPAAIESRIEALADSAQAEASATLDAEGCDSFMGRRLVRRHQMYANR